MARENAFFKQAAQLKEKLLSSMLPGQADAFIKILNAIFSFINRIRIQNSRLTASISNTTIVDIELEPLIGSKIDMTFNMKESILNQLKRIKGNLDVLIQHDSNTRTYIVTNGKLDVVLPEAMSIPIPVLPDFTNANVIAATVETDEASSIKQHFKNSSYANIAVFVNQLGYFERHDGDRFYLGEFSMFEYKSIKPTYLFRSYTFLPFDSESVSFSIFELRNCPKMYCLSTVINLGFNMKITTYERLTLIWR